MSAKNIVIIIVCAVVILVVGVFVYKTNHPSENYENIPKVSSVTDNFSNEIIRETENEISNPEGDSTVTITPVRNGLADQNTSGDEIDSSSANGETMNYISNSSSVTEEIEKVGSNEQNVKKNNINKIFSGVDLEQGDNSTINIGDIEDKSMAILFWRSDVDQANEVLDRLNAQFDNYSDKVQFIAIDVLIDEPMSKTDVIKNMNERGIKIPMLFDVNKSAMDAYNITFLPSLIFINKNKQVINTKEGAMSEDAIMANLDLISEKI